MAKQHELYEKYKDQISKKFQNIVDEKLEFISFQNMKNWYGINNNKAVDKLVAAWQEFWDTNWKPGGAPKLFVIGPIEKGYVIGRLDRQKDDWFWELGTDKPLRISVRR